MKTKIAILTVLLANIFIILPATTARNNLTIFILLCIFASPLLVPIYIGLSLFNSLVYSFAVAATLNGAQK